MSSIEEQLARDIVAVTQGVVMTDSDLREARDRMEERIDLKRRRDRRRTTLGALVAAVVISVLAFTAFQALDGDAKTAPANPGPSASVDPEADYLVGSAPTAESLAGIWRVDNGTTLLRFSADGEISFDDRGQLFADPAATGTYVLDGDRINITVDGGAADCAGQEIAMRASLPEQGSARVVHTKQGSGACMPEQTGRWVLEQVLPTSEILAGLEMPAKGDWKPAPDASSMYGVWLAQGGGHVLELAVDGTYTVAGPTGAVADTGQWTLSGERPQLTLVSAVGSPDCDGGDRLVLRNVGQIDPGGTTGMRGTVQQNACGGAWTPKTWALFPHIGGVT
jgi:hypothetical protein